MKNIGELLCEIRKDKGMTLQSVANMLNCSTSFISHWENNRRSIHVSNIINYCDKLNLELNINNENITVKDNVTLKIYSAKIKSNIEDFNIVRELEDFYIVTSYKKDSDIIFYSKDDSEARRGYSILLKDTLVTPYGLDAWFEDVDEAIESLGIFSTSIKFPHLYELAKSSGGKIVFLEQLSLCLYNLGLENPHKKLHDFCKWRKKEYADIIINFCKEKLGDYGNDLALEILRIAPNTYKKLLFDDYVAGYEGFLVSVTKRTNGKLKNIHQRHAMLSVLNPDSEIKVFSELDKYKLELTEIINKDVFKYGYPSFREKLLNSLS